MHRDNARKTAPSLEPLESRNLQTALPVGTTLPPVAVAAPASAVVTNFQGASANATHSYLSIGGFFSH